MKIATLIFLSGLTSGCALNTMDAYECNESGKCESSSYSNSLCAYHMKNSESYGLFFSESGTSINGGHFIGYVYNLGDESVSFELNKLKYYKLVPTPKSIIVPPKSKSQIADVRFVFDNPGDMTNVHYSLLANGSLDMGVVTLRREKHKSYMGAVMACRSPSNSEEFVERANKWLVPTLQSNAAQP